MRNCRILNSWTVLWIKLYHPQDWWIYVSISEGILFILNIVIIASRDLFCFILCVCVCVCVLIFLFFYFFFIGVDFYFFSFLIVRSHSFTRRPTTPTRDWSVVWIWKHMANNESIGPFKIYPISRVEVESPSCLARMAVPSQILVRRNCYNLIIFSFKMIIIITIITSLLRSARILRRVLETLGDFSEKPSASAGVKSSQKRKIINEWISK